MLSSFPDDIMVQLNLGNSPTGSLDWPVLGIVPVFILESGAPKTIYTENSSFWSWSFVFISARCGYHPLREKCPNTEFFLVRNFCIWTESCILYTVVSPNTGKYGPEKWLWYCMILRITCFNQNIFVHLARLYKYMQWLVYTRYGCLPSLLRCDIISISLNMVRRGFSCK